MKYVTLRFLAKYDSVVEELRFIPTSLLEFISAMSELNHRGRSDDQNGADRSEQHR